MKEISGQYTTAKVFTDNIEETAMKQIKELCNQDFIKDCKIRIMPDCHSGAGCVIGFTANLGDKIIPNIVGVDIGCGMLVVSLGKIKLDLKEVDDVIHNYVPAGREVHQSRIVKFPPLRILYCYRELKDTKRVERSIGTLGGKQNFCHLH